MHRLIVISLLLAPAASAQPVSLIADVRPELAEDEGSFPGFPVAAGGLVYFTAGDKAHGRELWASDLTPEGTALVRDLCPGPCSGVEHDFSSVALDGALVFSNLMDFPGVALQAEGLWRTRGTAATTALLVTGRTRNPTRLGDRVVFLRSPDDFNRATLWVTDGTAAGTRSLGADTEGAYALKAAGDRMYFFLSRDFSSTELWTTDGTAAGTSRIAGPWDRGPSRLTAAGERIFYAVVDELWASDGTSAGTRMLRRLAGFDTFDEEPFTALGDRIYFLDRDIGSVLWTSDGTAAGTRRVGAVCVETSCSLTTSSTATAGGRLFFVGQDETHGRELWVSDGTAAGTAMVLEASAGAAGEVSELTAVGDVVFFIATNGFERTLWRSDGTPQGTVLVLEGETDGPFNLIAGGETLFFEHRDDLWVSDGTVAGTRSLDSQQTLDPQLQTALDGRLFFTAFQDLWTSDGTDAGTRVVKDIGASRGRSSSPIRFAALGDRVYFSALEDDDAFISRFDRELWVSDRTAEGTAPVFVGPESQGLGLLTTLGDRLFFAADDGQELWQSDGTAEGSELLRTTNQIRAFETTSDRLWFLVNRALWTSDGTAEGTVRVTATASGETIGATTFFRAVGDLLYFLADTEETAGRRGLWVSDGTAAGTLRLAQDVSLTELAALDGTVYFAAGSCVNELWASDGTAHGTRRLERLGSSRSCNRRIRSLAAAEGGIYVMTSTDRGDMVQLWLNDGSPGGTRRLRTLPALPSAWEVITRYDERARSLLIAAGGRVFFAMASPAAGLELWSSDGERTGLVKDICPGACGSVPHYPEVIDGRLVFAAADGTSGWEPWVSDGTEAGTRRLADLAPGAASSSPRDFFAFGDAIVFQADDGVHGIEPWAVAPLGEGCGDDPRMACLLGGRFEVAVRWKNQHAGGTEGHGVAVPFSDDAALFWFFGPSNLELAVKLLDGRAFNQHFWLFSGGLSDIEHSLEITDRATGETRTYHNPPGEICGLRDLEAFFGGDAARGPVLETPLAAFAEPTLRKQGGCVAGARTLCLAGGRFRVEVDWRTADGEGRGTAQQGTDETGFFWFFGPSNLELIVKLLDGRALNGRFWFFYGALTDVEYRVTVTDTATGLRRVYHNPAGEMCGRGDTAAF